MSRLSDARDRFLKAGEAYDDRYSADEQKIIVDFLKPLANRTEAQNELLRELTEEATDHLRRFTTERANFTTQLSMQLQMLGIVGSGAQIAILRGGLAMPPLRTPTDQQSPGQAFADQLREWEANLKTIGERALQTVERGESLTCDLLDAGTALIVLRSATVATFSRENLLSPLEQVRQRLAEEMEKELGELFTDEVKEELVGMLIEYGGQVGEIVVEVLPGIGVVYKLVRGYFKATNAPEKYNIVGGGDLMIALLSSLQKQNALLKGFTHKLDKGYAELVRAEESLREPRPS